MNTVTLGGTATINDLVSVARFGAKVAFSKEYEERVNHCRAHVDRFSHEGKAIYGLTTGLGDNWKKFIPEKDRETIQRNNIYAHTCAVGEPIAEECTRAMMFVMLCHFGSGHTGIRLETLALIRDMLNAGISPIVPGHGSVGYLTLEGHIGMVMIGEGKATYQGETLDGAEALKRAGLKPVVLSSKEGLILLSGTTSVTAFASLAIYDAQTLSLTADIAGSFTLEVLKGTLMAMDERLMAVRALGAHHHRDAEAGMIDHIFLYYIIGFCGKFQHNAGLLIFICPRIGTVQAVQDAKPSHALYFLFKFLCQCKLLTLSLVNPESVQTLI